jgi:hypothetical protein
MAHEVLKSDVERMEQQLRQAKMWHGLPPLVGLVDFTSLHEHEHEEESDASQSPYNQND